GPLTLASLARTKTTVDEHARPAVIAEPGGRAVTMWSDEDLQPSPVMLSESGRSSRMLAPCGDVGDIARRADGRLIAAWSACAGAGGVVRAQSRSALGAWGRVRTIHHGEDRNVAASFEPGSGRPVVAWVNYDFDRRHGPDALMVAAGTPRPRR